MQSQHYAWVDVLRITACFLVVLAHCCDPFVAQFDACRTDFWAGAFWGSFYRPCVPLFIMISAVVLFPITGDTLQFYRRRLPRLVIPLIAWSVIMPLLFTLYFGVHTAIINPCISPSMFGWSQALHHIATAPLNFCYETTPYWYLYMAIGIYLILPLIGNWLATATARQMRVVIYLWLFAATLPYLQMLAPWLGYDGNGGNMGLLGVCDWNAYGTFYYLSGFIGYLITAVYFYRFPPQWTLRKTVSISALSWVAGFVLTTAGFILMQELYPADFSKLEIIWYFTGINVIMMTVPIFAVVQKIRFNSSPLFRRVASYTFGIYLCHFIVVHIAYEYLYPITLPAALKIPLFAAVSFAICCGVVWCASKIRYVRYIFGIK